MAKQNLTGRTFGARLRCAREVADLTQAALAAAVGIHRVNIHRYEHDQAVPALDIAWRLADAVGVALDELRPPRGDGG